MATDWIKMRAGLVNNPKVISITRALLDDNDFRHWLTPGTAAFSGQTVSTPALRCVTTALLMCVWSIARTHGKFVGNDLVLPLSRIKDIDEMAGAPGVGAAMAGVGWAAELPRNGGLILPNFIEFNVPMTTAEKQKEYRQRKKEEGKALPKRSNENAKSVTTREEKSREEDQEQELPKHTPRDLTEQGAGHADSEGVFEGHDGLPPGNTPEAQQRAGTEAGRACLLMKAAGCSRVNSQHVKLLAALQEGVTPKHSAPPPPKASPPASSSRSHGRSRSPAPAAPKAPA